VPFDRRKFLTGAAAATGAAMLRGRTLAAGAADPQGLIAGKDPRLIVHAKAPAVFETPAELLAGEQVTPMSLVFIRNNSQPSEAATIKPIGLDGWKIELAGLVDRPRTVDARVLADMEQVEREMVLQCSGNSRALFSQAAPVKGTPWGRGGMANVRFAGVPLARVLDRAGSHIKPEARFLTAEGKDSPAPPEQDFEHSLPLDEVLAKSIVALAMNGKPLPAIHGGPVRLVTPGYYGTMHVKWLTRLRFDARESDHTSQIPNYRTPLEPISPGRPFQFTYANSEPNWRMKIKCVVLAPAPGARVAAGEVTVGGVAFNDGEAKIDAVLVSRDEGLTWSRAELIVPESPYAWYRWKARLALSSGKAKVWARAIDALGRSQPLDGAIHWNPQGYTWNGVEKIEIDVG
jgi:DMSO/TMAO reductase YedYZ molybdopterin-dependent catalytic subunit